MLNLTVGMPPNHPPPAGPRSLMDKRTDPLGFSLLRFESPLGHMWESQVLIMDGQLFFFCRFSGFRPLLMNDQLDLSEIFLKGS